MTNRITIEKIGCTDTNVVDATKISSGYKIVGLNDYETGDVLIINDKLHFVKVEQEAPELLDLGKKTIEKYNEELRTKPKIIILKRADYKLGTIKCNTNDQTIMYPCFYKNQKIKIDDKKVPGLDFYVITSCPLIGNARGFDFEFKGKKLLRFHNYSHQHFLYGLS